MTGSVYAEYADPEIQIVICTAYSDYPWEDVSRRIEGTDRLLVLMRAFLNSIELVKQLAEMMEGAVRVESASGQGSTFGCTIRLKRMVAAMRPARAA